MFLSFFQKELLVQISAKQNHALFAEGGQNMLHTSSSISSECFMSLRSWQPSIRSNQEFWPSGVNGVRENVCERQKRSILLAVDPAESASQFFQWYIPCNLNHSAHYTVSWSLTVRHALLYKTRNHESWVKINVNMDSNDMSAVVQVNCNCLTLPCCCLTSVSRKNNFT